MGIATGQCFVCAFDHACIFAMQKIVIYHESANGHMNACFWITRRNDTE